MKLVSERRIVQVNSQSGGATRANVECNPDETITEGGFHTSVEDNPIIDSGQIQNGNGWTAAEHNSHSFDSTFTVFATCAHLEAVK